MNIDNLTVSQILSRELELGIHRVYSVDRGRVFGIKDVNEKRLSEIDDELKKLRPRQIGNVSVREKIGILLSERKYSEEDSYSKKLSRYGKKVALRFARSLEGLGRNQRDRVIGYEVFLESKPDTSNPLTKGFVGGIRKMFSREREQYANRMMSRAWGNAA